MIKFLTYLKRKNNTFKKSSITLYAVDFGKEEAAVP